jgi:hypothetical protein
LTWESREPRPAAKTTAGEEKEGKHMSRINATVTATDTGGKWAASIDPNPIHVPPGQHQIVIGLDDQTSNGPTTFNTADPVYYATGGNCPASGKNCAALDVDSCSDTQLTIGDDNGATEQIGYRLNFYYGNQKKDLDPIIINH